MDSDFRQGGNRDRYRNRFRQNDRGSHQGGGGRGRAQRPLLTSAINGCGLALVAAFVARQSPEGLQVARLLALAAACFGVSSIVSYAAQRLKPMIVELVSDFFFLVGAVMLIYVGLQVAGYLV